MDGVRDAGPPPRSSRWAAMAAANFPGSDVDLLDPAPRRPRRGAEGAAVERWSALVGLRLEVGHAVRTVDECMSAAADDITGADQCSSKRGWLTGNVELFAELQRAIHRKRSTCAPSSNAKLLEQEQRYACFNDTPYALEPNCKESPAVCATCRCWAGSRARPGSATATRPRPPRPSVTGGEAGELRAIERFLQHIRIRLHQLTGARRTACSSTTRKASPASSASRPPAHPARLRGADAALLPSPPNGDAAQHRILLQNYGSVIFPDRGAAIVVNARLPGRARAARHPRRGRLRAPALPRCSNASCCCSNSELKGHDRAHPARLWIHRNQVNAENRADPAHRACSCRSCSSIAASCGFPQDEPVRHPVGRYIPAGAHRRPDAARPLPRLYRRPAHPAWCCATCAASPWGARPRIPADDAPDQAFERPGCSTSPPCSTTSPKAAAATTPPWGRRARVLRGSTAWTRDDTALVWLVEQHLTMSRSRRRRTSDPAVIQRFADIVRDERRLVALYLLTVADIRGTSPEGVERDGRANPLRICSSMPTLAARRHYQGRARSRRPPSRKPAASCGSTARAPASRTHCGPGSIRCIHAPRSAEEIAWHARVLYYRPELTSRGPARLRGRGWRAGDGVHPRPEGTLRSPHRAFRAHGLHHRRRQGPPPHATATRPTASCCRTRANRPPIATSILIEHELTARLQKPGVPGAPQPRENVAPGQALSDQPRRSASAPTRPVATTCLAHRRRPPRAALRCRRGGPEHGIRLHTAKIATLGERVEDTFLLTGNALEPGRAGAQDRARTARAAAGEGAETPAQTGSARSPGGAPTFAARKARTFTPLSALARQPVHRGVEQALRTGRSRGCPPSSRAGGR